MTGVQTCALPILDFPAPEEPIKATFSPALIEILKSLKTFSPYIIVHIDEVDPEQVRDILLNYIAETEHHESVFQKILERFGF